MAVTRLKPSTAANLRGGNANTPAPVPCAEPPLILEPPVSTDHSHLFIILAEQSPYAVLRIARDGTILYGNPLAAEWFDLTSDTLVGANVHDIFPQLDCGGSWRNLLEETCATGTPRHARLSITHKNSVRILDIQTTSESNAHTHCNAVVATIRDSSESYSHEQQLSEANLRLLYHMNNSPLAVIEWDNAGACLAWNDEAENLFGWTHREAAQLFNNCLPLIHRDDRPIFLKTYKNLKAGCETSAFLPCRSVSRNNSISWCEWYLSSLMDDSGGSKGILCFVNDVTERELSERKLQTLAAVLEKRIALRSKLLDTAHQNLKREHLVRRQLERDMVRISEREHRRIGHDLHDGICQELAGIRFAVSAMAASHTRDTSLHTKLLQIEEATIRAMEETRLLARGLAPMELEHGDIDSSLRELASNIAKLHDIACRVHRRGPKQNLPPETATHLFRIAQEAVNNSIHHGAANTIQIRLSIGTRSIRLTVDDNGTGLPPKNTPTPIGRGMGKKIMHHRASLIGGHVSLAPRKNSSGTRLICTVPSQAAQIHHAKPEKNPDQNTDCR